MAIAERIPAAGAAGYAELAGIKSGMATVESERATVRDPGDATAEAVELDTWRLWLLVNLRERAEGLTSHQKALEQDEGVGRPRVLVVVEFEASELGSGGIDDDAVRGGQPKMGVTPE